MKSISEKQHQIIKFIEKFSEEQGYPPAVREICKAVGLSSPSTVHAHINTLCSLGYLSKDNNKTRSLTITHPKKPKTSLHVPLLGTVSAGYPIFAEENIESYIPYSNGNNYHEYFALKISGNSMINAGIFDGDVVVVKKQNTANNNEIVIALLEDEATCKRFYKGNGKILLLPENPDYSPIEANECTILGIVCALNRLY